MKRKLNYILIMFLFVFIGMMSVNAASLSVKPSNVNASTATKDNTFIVSFTGASNNEWRLSYDSLVYVVGTPPLSNGILSAEEGSVTFAVKKGLSLTENKTVNIKIINENSGEEVKTSIVINKNVPTTTSTTTTAKAPEVTQPAPVKSNNANLKNIEVTKEDGKIFELSPAFKSDVYEYSIIVEGSIKTVNITPTLEDEKANVVLSNNADDELKIGENNKIVITVTAESGLQKAYTLNIKREALTADATLKSLYIKECEEFKLLDDKFSYNINVDKNISSLTLDYETSSDKAEVSVSGNENIENNSKVKILVTAEDGTKREYILNIIKEIEKTTKKIEPANVIEEKNPLVIMMLSMIGFGLIGAIIYVAKK